METHSNNVINYSQHGNGKLSMTKFYVQPINHYYGYIDV